MIKQLEPFPVNPPAWLNGNRHTRELWRDYACRSREARMSAETRRQENLLLDYCSAISSLLLGTPEMHSIGRRINAIERYTSSGRNDVDVKPMFIKELRKAGEINRRALLLAEARAQELGRPAGNVDKRMQRLCQSVLAVGKIKTAEQHTPGKTTVIHDDSRIQTGDRRL